MFSSSSISARGRGPFSSSLGGDLGAPTTNGHGPERFDPPGTRLQSPYGARLNFSRPPSEVGDPRGAGGGVEVLQQDWNKADCAKTKVFELEMNMVKEQMTQISQLVEGLAALRSDMLTIKDDQSVEIRALKDQRLPVRMDQTAEHMLQLEKNLERKLSDSFDQQVQQANDVARQLQDIQGQIQNDKDSRLGQQSIIEQRFNYFDGFVKESIEKHAKELDTAKNQVAAINGSKAALNQRLHVVEKSLGDSADAHERAAKDIELTRQRLQELAGHAQDQMEVNERSASQLAERLDCLQRYTAETLDKHNKDLIDHSKELSGVHDKFDDIFRRRIDESLRTFKAEKETREKQLSVLEDRSARLEKLCADSTDKHAKDINIVHTRMQEVEGQANNLSAQANGDKKSREAQQSSLQQRLEHLENLCNGAVDKQKELDSGLQLLQDRHGQSKNDVLMTQKSLQDLGARVTDLASMPQRIGFIEKMLNDSADKHNKQVQDVDFLNKGLNELKSRVGEFQTQVAGDKKTRDSQHSAIQDRIDLHQKGLMDNLDKHNELSASHKFMQDKHGEHKSELEAAHKKLNESHSTAGQRVAQLEQFLNESGEKQVRHAEEFTRLQKAVQDRLGEVHGNSTNEKKIRDTQHADVLQRVELLEKSQGSASDRQKELETQQRSMIDVHGIMKGDVEKKMQELYGRLQECGTELQKMSTLEKFASECGQSMKNHCEDLDAVQKNFVDMTNRLGELGLTVDADKKLRDGSQAKADQRTDRLEQGTAEILEQHKALESFCKLLENSHGNSQNELDNVMKKMMEGQGESQHRMDRLEAAHGETTTKSDKNVMELEYMQKNLQDCASRLSELSTNKANEKRVSDNNYANVQQRVEFLEKLSESSDTKHKEMEAACRMLHEVSSQAKLDAETAQKKIGDLNTRIQEQANHPQRIAYLEKLVQDSGEKHDRHGSDFDNLQKGMQELRTKTGELHSAELIERQTRDHNHTALQHRVGIIEKNSDEASERHREVEAGQRKLQEVVGSTRGEMEVGHKRVQDVQLAIQQRLDLLSRSSTENADLQNKELREARAQLMNVEGRIGETHGHIRNEIDAREQFQAKLGSRIENIEQVLDNSAAQHQHHQGALQEFHTMVTGEKQTREAGHGMMLQRLTNLEQDAKDSANQRGKEMDRLDGNLVIERQEREKHHAVVDQRMKFVEAKVGDLRHGGGGVDRTEVDKFQSRLDQIGDHVRQAHEGHQELDVRVQFLESKVCDTDGKHLKELEMAEHVAHEQQDISQRLQALTKPLGSHDYTPTPDGGLGKGFPTSRSMLMSPASLSGGLAHASSTPLATAFGGSMYPGSPTRSGRGTPLTARSPSPSPSRSISQR